MVVTCLEGVPGEGDVGEGDDLAIALPNLKVLKQHNCWIWFESLPMELSAHNYLPQPVTMLACHDNNDFSM